MGQTLKIDEILGHGGCVDCCVLRKNERKRTRDEILTPVANVPSLREACVPRLLRVLHVCAVLVKN